MQQRLPIAIESRAPEPDQVRSSPAGLGDWRIDERTRRVGLRGLERARAALDATGAIGPSCEADAA